MNREATIEWKQWEKRIEPVRKFCEQNRGTITALTAAFCKASRRNVDRVTVTGWITGKHEPLAGTAMLLLDVAEKVMDERKE